MEPHKVFDSIPEEFDKYRPRYCPEAISANAKIADLKPGRLILKIAPGIGQAREPFCRPEPNRTAFMNGRKDAVNAYGGVWKRLDRVNLVFTKKPE